MASPDHHGFLGDDRSLVKAHLAAAEAAERKKRQLLDAVNKENARTGDLSAAEGKSPSAHRREVQAAEERVNATLDQIQTGELIDFDEASRSLIESTRASVQAEVALEAAAARERRRREATKQLPEAYLQHVRTAQMAKKQESRKASAV